MKKIKYFLILVLFSFVLLSCNKTNNSDDNIEFETKTFNILENDNVKNIDQVKMFGLYLLSSMQKQKDPEEKYLNMTNDEPSNFDEFVNDIRNETKEDASIVKLRKTFDENEDNIYSFIFSDESTYDLIIPNSKLEYTFNEIVSIERLNHKNFKIKFYDNKTYVFDINDTFLSITISSNYTWVINGYDTQIPVVVNNNYVTVSFDTGVDKLYISRQIIEKNQKAVEPKMHARNGYEFEGWYNKNKKWDFNDTVNKSLKLTAKWKKDF